MTVVACVVVPSHTTSLMHTHAHTRKHVSTGGDSLTRGHSRTLGILAAEPRALEKHGWTQATKPQAQRKATWSNCASHRCGGRSWWARSHARVSSCGASGSSRKEKAPISTRGNCNTSSIDRHCRAKLTFGCALNGAYPRIHGPAHAFASAHISTRSHTHARTHTHAHNDVRRQAKSSQRTQRQHIRIMHRHERAELQRLSYGSHYLKQVHMR